MKRFSVYASILMLAGLVGTGCDLQTVASGLSATDQLCNGSSPDACTPKPNPNPDPDSNLNPGPNSARDVRTAS